MTVQERIIVPVLGVAILLAVFTMGAPVLYMVLLGLLGLAAVGTYFAPPVVQVETRAGIAVLGLVILVFYFSSLSFWLALLSFGAIGVLQVRHRGMLRKNPATIEWVNAVLARRGSAAAQTGGGGESSDGGANAASGKSGAGVFRRRMTGAAIGAPVMGVIALVSPTLPWVALFFSGSGESVTIGISGLETGELVREDGGGNVINLVVGAGVVLALLSIPSLFLPRVVPVIVGIAGMLLVVFAFVYVYIQFSETLAEEAGYYGLNATLLPHVGFFVTGGAFLLVALLHIIPAACRPIGGNRSSD